MKFTGVLIHLDGKVDKQGDSFAHNAKIELPEDGEVPVTIEFNKSLDDLVGRAKVYKKGNTVRYSFEMSPYTNIPASMFKLLTPCAGGSIVKRRGKKIVEAKINQIGLAVRNSDPRIKKLGEK